MARVPMITRTLKTSIVDLLCVDLNTQQSTIIKVRLPRAYKNDKDILKIAPNFVDENIKVVHVLNVEIEPKLYGMTEEDFIKFADELPARVNADESVEAESNSDAE